MNESEEEALRRRNLALRAVEEHAPEDWKDRAYQALLRRLLENPTFFCDEIWSGLDRPDEPRAIGTIIAHVAREGLMEQSGEFRRSTSSNLSWKPVWRSLIYRQARAA